MSAEPARRTFTAPALSFALLFILCALVCFGFAECVLQGWFTRGTPAEWFVGGFIFSTLAKLPI